MTLSIQEEMQLDLNDIDELLQSSLNEGYRHIQRLYDDYKSGHNRFTQSGESLYTARYGNRVIGICGLNQDPVFGKGFSRLRRLYVLHEYRRSGVGRSLTETIMGGAKSHFRTIMLKTDNPDAHKFYISLGFITCIDIENVTHRFDFI